jgi:hypothetical protein
VFHELSHNLHVLSPRSLPAEQINHHGWHVIETACQRFRSEQSTGGSTPVVFLFGGGDLRLRTWRLYRSTWNTGDTMSLYWFGPLESKTLRLILDCIDLGWLRLGMTWPQGFGLVRLILADGQGRWTQSPGRLQQGNQSKESYNMIPWSSDWLVAQPMSSALSYTPSYPTGSDKVARGIFWKVFGNSRGWRND